MKAKITGLNNSSSIVKAIANYCHSGHGMKYDTVSGGSQFGASGSGSGKFQLMNYILRKGKKENVVNCYDQAAVVQAFAGSAGVATDWLYLAPYGYISKTNLVGIGPCNNPFFSSNDSQPLVADNDPKRTAFGNHAFVSSSKKIHDACAGPHTGSETLRQYLVAAIDANATILSIAPGYTRDALYDALEKRALPQIGLTGVQ